MANPVLIDGLDDYNGTGANTGLLAKWTPQSGATPMSLVSGLAGSSGQAVSLASASGNTHRILRSFTGGAVSAGTVSLYFKVTAMPTTDPSGSQMGLQSAGTFMIGWSITSLGEIVARRHTSVSASTELGRSAASVIAVSTEYHVETIFTIHDTTGSIEVKVNGASVLNLTNVDTRNGTPTTVDTIAIGPATNSANTGTYVYDHVIVMDAATAIGDSIVEALTVTADTAQKDFTPSAGTDNYACVDEAQVSTTDYVQGSTVGNTDRYAVANLSNTPTTIHGVQISAYAKKTDAGTRSIALQCKSGATTSDGANFALGTSDAKFERIMSTDPNTSSAWAGGGVDAIEIGPKVTV